jgi:threonylcarbamoyladenosine tRNA methylthiotransferase MtaB
MLQRMRRRYTSTDYAEAAARTLAAASGAAITADVIIGFPGETDEEFGDSLSFAAGMEFASMHVFPYSVRPGTSAAYMGPPVPDQTKAERMKAMLALADQQASAFRGRAIGSMRSVLWERQDLRDGKVVSTGLTDNYLRVYTEQGAPLNEVTSALLLKEVGQGLLVGNLQPPMWNES